MHTGGQLIVEASGSAARVALGRARPGTRRPLLAVSWRSRRDERIDQSPCDGGHIVHRLIECLLIGLGRLREARKLAYELYRRRADLLVRGGRIEVEEGTDVSTHGSILTGLKPSITSQTIRALQGRTSSLAESIRNLSHQLHSSVLQHAGLAATLQRHCADIERHHRLNVTFSAEGRFDSLDPDVALCLFRVAHEALTNAVRHGRVRHGRARTIRAELMATVDSVTLAVLDDGVGFVTSDCAGSGLGYAASTSAYGSRAAAFGWNRNQGTKVVGRILLAHGSTAG